MKTNQQNKTQNEMNETLQQKQPFNPYQNGWLLVAIRLCNRTSSQRNAARTFRAYLKRHTFMQLFPGLYIRPGVTVANYSTHAEELRQHLPPDGVLRAWFITDLQWGRSYVMYGVPKQMGANQ